MRNSPGRVTPAHKISSMELINGMRLSELATYYRMYAWCEVIDPDGNIARLVGVVKTMAHVQYGGITGPVRQFDIRVLKLVLRPVVTMNRGYAQAWFKVRRKASDKFRGYGGTGYGSHAGCVNAAETTYLISRQFDVFQLIERGLAVNKDNYERTGI